MKKLQLALAGLVAAGTLSLSAMAPASADGAASTRNIIIGAAALAGLAIESNVARKNAQANAISGYLPDGSPVYGDGHVVGRDGTPYYPGNNGQTVACDNGRCNVAYGNQNGDGYNGNGYNGNGYNGNDAYNGGWSGVNRNVRFAQNRNAHPNDR